MADDILDIIEIGLTLRFAETEQSGKPGTEIVSEFIQEFRQGWGGSRYYVKRGFRKHSPDIKRIIRRDYNGKNGAELRQRLGVSRTTFYELIKKSG